MDDTEKTVVSGSASSLPPNQDGGANSSETEKTVVAGGLPSMPPSASESEPFYKIWIKALTQPNEKTYAEIANSPSSNLTTAFLWMLIAALVTSFFANLVSILAGSAMAPVSGMEQLSNPLVSLLCGAPFTAVLSVLAFAIGVGIVQWVASLFGGTGTYSKLAYVVAAYSAPFGMITGFIAAIVSLIPYLGLCFYFLIILVSLFLEVTAVKAVNNFDWGKAAMSVLIPFFVIVFVCGCLIIGLLMLLGPVIGDVFSTINSSLGY